MSWRPGVRRSLPYVIVAAGGFLLAYLVVFFVVFPSRIVPNDVRVPSVVGLDRADAARRLAAAGFTMATGEQRFHATAPKGTVLAQSPGSASAQTPGSRVTLDISAGQRSAAVPSVAGMPRQQAQVALENAGFDVGIVREQATDAGARGAVLASDPASGTTLVLPASVNIVVSSGPATVRVPDVVGMSFPQARSAIEQLGLGIRSPTIEPPPPPDTLGVAPAPAAPNTVVRQEPVAGQVVIAGTGVRLTVTGRP